MQNKSSHLALVSVPVFLVASACQPALPPVDWSGGGGSGGTSSQSPFIDIEPEAPLKSAPHVLRFRVHPTEGAEVDPQRLLFVEGRVSHAHARQLTEEGELSAALSARALQVLVWHEEGGEAIVAPVFPLNPGEKYGVLSGDPALDADVTVSKTDPLPTLTRVWPPSPLPTVSEKGAILAAPEVGPFAIYCAETPLSEPPSTLFLSPGNIPASVTPAIQSAIAPNCFQIEVQGVTPPPNKSCATDEDANCIQSEPLHENTLMAVEKGLAVPPPNLLFQDGQEVHLDPTPLPVHTPKAQGSPLTLPCLAPAIPFGPGCALVADDRLLITPPDEALFWAVELHTSQKTVVHVSDRLAQWPLTGLLPGSEEDVSVLAMDALGRTTNSTLHVKTKTKEAHLIINEVFANPLGPEPAQEWVELYNDGLADADLSGLILTDLGGDTVLPSAILPPGQFALLVNEGFVEDDEVDPPATPGTLLVKVPKLGTGGLKNDGEPLKLHTADGVVLSRFPGLPKPKAGLAVTRLTPRAPDSDAKAFVVVPATPGSPFVPANSD